MLPVTTSTPRIDKLIAAKMDPPYDVLSSSVGVWCVRNRPVAIGDGADKVGPSPKDWKIVREGEAVTVPLFAYEIQLENPSAVVGAIVGLALRTVLSGRAANHVHVSIGDPIEESTEGPKTYRVWMGMAYRVR